MKGRISLSQGDGTKSTYQLIQDVFVKRLSNRYLSEVSDAAKIGDIAFSCDSFTVNPIYFPSSNIGKLAIYGTVNDICVSAAIPLYISLAIIVEEGFLRDDLEKLADSIAEAALKAEVQVVCGDFKVVEKNKADKIFIITSGIGTSIKRRSSSTNNIKDGDKIIITGPIAEHGIAILLSRNKIFEFNIESDCQSLRNITLPLWKNFSSIKFMRDPTRGGLASVLNEISLSRGLGIKIIEEKVPIKEDVNAACELLGIDPYYLASEGRALIVVEEKQARDVVKFLKNNGEKQASIVGQFSKKTKGVVLKTVVGGERILDFSHALNLPRIC